MPKVRGVPTNLDMKASRSLDTLLALMSNAKADDLHNVICIYICIYHDLMANPYDLIWPSMAAWHEHA